MDDYPRRFAPLQKVKKRPSEDGCTIETKITRTGKKVIIGKGCSREQVQLIKESGELNFSEHSVNNDGAS
jgi:hypothetical protein